jgi:hypothetical protein
MLWLLVTATKVPNSQILVTLMMEAISSSETSILTRATWHNIQMAFFTVTAMKTSVNKEKKISDNMSCDA